MINEYIEQPVPQAPEVWSQEYYDSVVASIEPYQRPSEWPALTTAEDQVVVGLYAVYNNDSNFIAFTNSGATTVDFGDGSAPVNYAAGVQVNYNYNFAAGGLTNTTYGYKVAIVRITPQVSNNLTSINLYIKHNQTGLVNGGQTGWLDIKVRALSFLTTLTIGSTGTNVRQSNLQQFEFIGTHTLTSIVGLFSNCFALRNVISIPQGVGITTSASMFAGCYALTNLPSIIDVSGATSILGMFNGCLRLKAIPMVLMRTTGSVTASSFAAGCSSLLAIPLLNTERWTNLSSSFFQCFNLNNFPPLNFSNVGDATSAFNSCYGMKRYPAMNFSIMTACSSMFLNNWSLVESPVLTTPTTGLGVITSMFQNCHAMRVVYSFNTNSVTTANNMFSNCYSLEETPAFNFSNVTSIISIFQNDYRIRKIGALDLAAVSSSANIASAFNTCNSLADTAVSGLRFTHSYDACRLSAPALVEIFNNLPTITAQTITITNNWGASLLTAPERAIATGKGWTIVG